MTASADTLENSANSGQVGQKCWNTIKKKARAPVRSAKHPKTVVLIVKSQQPKVQPVNPPKPKTSRAPAKPKQAQALPATEKRSIESLARVSQDRISAPVCKHGLKYNYGIVSRPPARTQKAVSYSCEDMNMFPSLLSKSAEEQTVVVDLPSDSYCKVMKASCKPTAPKVPTLKMQEKPSSQGTRKKEAKRRREQEAIA
jgi:hypothetical protein